jgi:hypothetical protein
VQVLVDLGALATGVKEEQDRPSNGHAEDEGDFTGAQTFACDSTTLLRERATRPPGRLVSVACDTRTRVFDDDEPGRSSNPGSPTTSSRAHLSPLDQGERSSRPEGFAAARAGHLHDDPKER